MTISKKLFTTGVSASLILGLAACGGDSESGDNGAAGGDGETVTLILGHEGSEEDPRQTAALRLQELVEEATEGRVAIEIQANGTLGNWEQMIEGLQFGSTDIVIESLLTLESYSELASIETAPFIYEDAEHFTSVWEGDIGEDIRSTITEETGFALSGNMFRGARELSTKTPVTSIDDLEGQTIRTPAAPTMVETWEDLGARAEAMPWDEVYSAIEQGVLDGQENPLSSILFASIHEVSPEITMTSHVYANFHFIMWDERLQELSEEDREALFEAGTTVGQEYTESIQEDEEEYRAQMEEEGATFHELTDREEWVEATQPVIESLPEQAQEWATQITESE
ncbi:TRAP transporter substrate-binding protein [Nesterenkonia aurantiaca]|uniref:TRAP transporter substrate-binding protein n=1 Tax=Nesterenkonia aurantiaca TaxID=1436010 RepID=UPI003EE43940